LKAVGKIQKENYETIKELEKTERDFKTWNDIHKAKENLRKTEKEVQDLKDKINPVG
jgi:hypothetical protein